MKTYLLCYDIKDDKRLYKVRKSSYPFALGGQKSALEAPLSPKYLKKYLKAVVPILNPHEDKLNIIEIDPNPIILGKNLHITYDQGVIII